MRNSKKQAISTPDVRRLKIQPKIRINKYGQKRVPELKLSGNWLQNMGFQFGSTVTITSMPNLLIIQAKE